MSKLLYPLLAFTVGGCMTSDTDTLSSTEQLGQVTVCHYDGAGRVRQITISEDAAAAHESHHGDHGLLTFYADADGDGFGSGAAISACARPAGTVTTDGDCDDGDAAINPAALEICGDGYDNDCDGNSATPSTFYTDSDGDGYGGAVVSACGQPPGTTTSAGDCNDGNAAINPAAAEVCGDNTDNNCDGQFAQSNAIFMFGSSGGQQFNGGPGCTTHRQVTAKICRETPTQVVRLSSSGDGAGNAYYDELATVLVQTPNGTTVGANYLFWEPTCINGSLPVIPMGTAPTKLDITPLFGAEFGEFTVTVQVRNAHQPYEWYETWLVPVN